MHQSQSIGVVYTRVNARRVLSLNQPLYRKRVDIRPVVGHILFPVCAEVIFDYLGTRIQCRAGR